MTKLSIEDYETYIAPLIAKCAKKDCSAYLEITRNLRQSKETPEEQREIIILFDKICFYRLAPYSSNGPLEPHCIWPGQTMSIKNNFTDCERDFLQEVLPKITDSELRARVADILWISKHGKSYEHAKNAVEAYLQSADTFLKECFFDIRNRLARALHIFIYIQLFRQENIPQKLNAPKKIFEYIEDSANPRHLVMRLVEVLHKAKQPYNAKHAEILETIATSHETEENYNAAQDVWDLTADLYEQAKMPEDAIRCRVKAAETYVTQANKLEDEQNPSYLKITGFLDNATKVYRAILPNKKERYDEIFTRLVEAQPKIKDEMRAASVEIDVSELTKRAIEKVSGCDIFTALFNFAFIGRPPHYETMEKQMKDREQSSPLLAMAPTQKLNHKGRVISTSSPNSSPESKVHEHIAPLHRKLLSESTLIPALEQIRQEHDVSLFDWKDLLKEHPFIPPERVHVYAHGLSLGIQGDFLSAAHILIPQIENSIRYILNNHGKQTSRQIMSGSQRENSLNKTLGYKELKEIMHKDLIFDLQGLLIMPEGTNLRNDLMHGLLDDDQLFTPDMVYLYWLTLHIIFMPIKVVSKENPDESPPTT